MTCLFICTAQGRTQAGHTAGEHLDLLFQVTQLVSIWVRALCLCGAVLWLGVAQRFCEESWQQQLTLTERALV